MNSDMNIAVFTTHKAASMFIFKLCGALAKEKGIALHSINGLPHSPHYDYSKGRPFSFTTGCFSPLRFYCPVPASFKTILHLRDPRDMMTSFYYSAAYSHELNSPENVDNRADALRMGIDDYVLDRSDLVKERYEQYECILDSSVFVRYEEMVTDFESWLRKFIVPFEFGQPDAVVAKFCKMFEHEFDVSSEDIYRHKRQVLPGDHRVKLKPETIKELTDKFSKVLKLYGWMIL
jgi:hypothetical protein